MIVNEAVHLAQALDTDGVQYDVDTYVLYVHLSHSHHTRVLTCGSHAQYEHKSWTDDLFLLNSLGLVWYIKTTTVQAMTPLSVLLTVTTRSGSSPNHPRNREIYNHEGYNDTPCAPWEIVSGARSLQRLIESDDYAWSPRDVDKLLCYWETNRTYAHCIVIWEDVR
eukprot:6669123-Pyramimonas_sp.AAC.1